MPFRPLATALTFALTTALPLQAAQADDFQPIRDLQAFLKLVEDRELRIGLYNLTLKVLPDGRIDGKALGWTITGNWAWQDGYFCREMDWSGKAIPFDCQLVEADGTTALRFTVNKGSGDSADFRLR